jgi:hypothetical protein
MMSDKEFAELELRATIVPGQSGWPKPECIPWQRLHDAANEARARVTKAYTEMDEIDRNASLSSDIKYRRRCEIADQAIADLEASKTLARARQAMEVAAARSELEGSALKALKELEKGWERAIAKIAERAGLTHRVYTVTPGPILQRRAFG